MERGATALLAKRASLLIKQSRHPCAEDAICIAAREERIAVPRRRIDAKLQRIAYEEAKAGYDEGGYPIGSVLAEGERIVAQGRNQRVQRGDPIAHGGRRKRRSSELHGDLP